LLLSAARTTVALHTLPFFIRTPPPNNDCQPAEEKWGEKTLNMDRESGESGIERGREKRKRRSESWRERKNKETKRKKERKKGER
jgi:hypothetical protein